MDCISQESLALCLDRVCPAASEFAIIDGGTHHCACNHVTVPSQTRDQALSFIRALVDFVCYYQTTFKSLCERTATSIPIEHTLFHTMDKSVPLEGVGSA